MRILNPKAEFRIFLSRKGWRIALRVQASRDKMYRMIRQFRTEDAASCSRLIHACIQSDLTYSPPIREALCGRETPESMAERAKLFYMAVYESGDGVLGVAGLDMNEVRLLYVDPAHQRCGIGRILLEHLISMVPGTVFSDIYVYSSEQAVGFYRACGFIEKGPFVFDIGGLPLRTIFMTLPARPV
jgi:GNAT superfamily N-acetyltransferase